MHTKFVFIFNFNLVERAPVSHSRMHTTNTGWTVCLGARGWEGGGSKTEGEREKEKKLKKNEIIIIETAVWSVCNARIRCSIWNWVDTRKCTLSEYTIYTCIQFYLYIRRQIRAHTTQKRTEHWNWVEQSRAEQHTVATHSCWPNPRCNALSPPSTEHYILFCFPSTIIIIVIMDSRKRHFMRGRILCGRFLCSNFVIWSRAF